MKCIVVDDDLMSQKMVEGLVKKTPVLEHIGTYGSAIEASAAITEKHIDLIFLDVEMPEMTGLDLLKTLHNPPQIILVTSKQNYALDAFEYNVTDYLLKPIDSYSRFLKAVMKAKENIDKAIEVPTEADGSNGPENLFIKVDSLLVNFDLKEILLVEAYGDYVKIHTAGGKVHTVYAKMKDIEGKLPITDFLRVHRSFIVRLDKIKNIDSSNLQIAEKIIPISNSYKPKLMERINTL